MNQVLLIERRSVMDKQLQQAVSSLIEKSLSAFEKGADFMAAQLPDVVQQLLLWHLASKKR